jgi:transcriptional regulator with XRE-family HTH domain
MWRSADLGQAIVFLAEKAGLSQSELAAASGVSDKTISAWSNGRRMPSQQALGKVVHALRCTRDDVEEVAEFHRKWRLRMEQPGKTAPSIGNARAAHPSSEDEHFRAIGRSVRELWDLLWEPRKVRSS